MRKILTIMLLVLSASLVEAQVNIGGSVYGGARKANVGGYAFVNIGADHNDIILSAVYGGNDISGTIGSSTTLPAQLTEAATNGITAEAGYNTFIRTNVEGSTTVGEGDEAVTTQHHLFIGQLFGGGNGDYTYTSDGNGTYTVTDADNSVLAEKGNHPEVAKAYLELTGGTFGYVYGGGNNATVTAATDICIDNQSTTITKVSTDTSTDNDEGVVVKSAELIAMGINTEYYSHDFLFSRVFGGNNKAAMNICPTWHLQRGSIENLYSGGNEGNMTASNGLLLEIATGSNIVVDNVYGGCRKANVAPIGDDYQYEYKYTAANNKIYTFPEGLCARVLVCGGDINNVYGGNDVSGSVVGGNAVGVHTSIRGDIYGGGNGSYPYTDNANLKGNLHYGDFYYNPDTAASSVEALNAFRPNAEQVAIRVTGESLTKPTVIGGSIYVGGNSATLKKNDAIAKPLVTLIMGRFVYADNVFLGNNGANMVKNTNPDDVLQIYASNNKTTDNTKFTSLDMTDPTTFANYMKGAEMSLIPTVTFDPDLNYDSWIGSFFCGGNVGSMSYTGTNTQDLNMKLIVYNKLVGGCNNAYVPAKDDINAAFSGGIIGEPDPTTKNKVVFNLGGVMIEPRRWLKDTNGDYELDTNGNRQLVWNTIYSSTKAETEAVTEAKDFDAATDLDRRFDGGNVYGGCYSSGIVNGNVVININHNLIDRAKLFDAVEEDEQGEAVLYGEDVLTGLTTYNITERHTGVILGQQGMDVLGSALNVFGGGKGKDTEIWGSTTINLNTGYAFQVFGGSEEGVIGKSVDSGGTYSFNNKQFAYNPLYSCYINLRGNYAGVSKTDKSSNPDMAEAEFLYGGGFFGPICGNTVINLGKGRVFNTFAGSCNADILGHTETYIGKQKNADNTDAGEGFPYIRDYVYGGNDMGGQILNTADFVSRVRDDVKTQVHGYDTGTATSPMLTASAYVEYLQGRALGIFGGCYGTYNYKSEKYRDYTDDSGTAKDGFTKPRMDNAFVNFRPTYTAALANNKSNIVSTIYGAGQGYPGDGDRDLMQKRSYVLIDIPQTMTNYQKMEVFGAGAWGGLGMDTFVASDASDADRDAKSAIIDLTRGTIANVYGGSFKEGFTRRTMVSVPTGSTIRAKKIFGGAYGVTNEAVCDVYEANVEYHSEEARVSALYGGNNSYRRTLYGRVNVDVPAWTTKETNWLATVYGAGYGENTWSEYTTVNLANGAVVANVYGGGENGRVMNRQTAAKWMTANSYPTAIGTGYSDLGFSDPLVVETDLGGKYNTNVLIRRGAFVGPNAKTGGTGYAYGGGKGTANIEKSGDVNGTTYIALLGGTAYHDIYAAGSVGAVLDEYGESAFDDADRFIAGTNAYVLGGSTRNVFGGGYMGSVGKHKGEISDSPDNDIPGYTNVVIGIRPDQLSVPITYGPYGYYNGTPTVLRNAYAGGEGQSEKGGRGGAVYGMANITLNNGYIGYYYDADSNSFLEKLHDETWNDGVGLNRLADYGCVFGGGYSDRSNVDSTRVTMWNGLVRGCVYGGGELASVGRGSTKESGTMNVSRVFEAMYKAGKTHVEIYNGHVVRNVFGGGKGYNLLGFGGANELYTDGYVFGQTEVYIHGGEVGTADNVTLDPEQPGQGYGNVFGGGDLGYIYGLGYGTPKTNQQIGTGSPNHIYYYDSDNNLTEDCKVVVAPYLQAKGDCTINGHQYHLYDYVPTDDLNYLPRKDKDTGLWSGGWENLFTEEYTDEVDEDGNAVMKECGITIHNAVFGGGNRTTNATQYANATTIFGNTTATIYDVYHRDFITLGTEHIGGLYGGGNLTLVNGYRELNITNYGTDYHNLSTRITLAQYRNLSNREKAYFSLEYVCKDGTEKGTDNGVEKQGVWIGTGEERTFYPNGKRVKEEDFEKLKSKAGFNQDNWEQYGFCSIYAGRLLNTIQRADLCGVYGSRMVLQGARDRVTDVKENIDYTINRVGELSLNKQVSRLTETDDDDKTHGNYFGIYNVVHNLGNLTSDVHFGDAYVDPSKHTLGGTTYYSYKSEHYTNNKRNLGRSRNQVALASGAWLELTVETEDDHTEYGYITGVVELDLINVKQSKEGGGFVYARNEHRIPKIYPNKRNIILSKYNQGPHFEGYQDNDACTYKQYRYSNDAGDWDDNDPDLDTQGGDKTKAYTIVPYQTSGNFIHYDKDIVDDCHPTNNAYDHDNADDPTKFAPAHIWYIKGQVYVYKQEVSAYTGNANAYSMAVHLPLTITAASHGRLKLINVQPNLYAYRTPDGKKIGCDAEHAKLTVNNETEDFQLNDVITWWDWNNLTRTDKYANDGKPLFVSQTYVNSVPCTIDDTDYAVGEFVMDDTDLNTFKGEEHTITYHDDHGILTAVTDSDTFNYVFRTSNNISHDTGYVLTIDMDSPKPWDVYYTNRTDASVKLSSADYNAQYAAANDAGKRELESNYTLGPTFRTVNQGFYGKRDYLKNQIVNQAEWNSTNITDREKMPRAYVATDAVTCTIDGTEQTINAGTAISKTQYDALPTTDKDVFKPALVVNTSMRLAEEVYLLMGELKSQDELDVLIANFPDQVEQIRGAVSNAYICSETGSYGGQQYIAGTNYGTITSWCALSAADRTDNFVFNYDALDLLIDPNYSVDGTSKTVNQVYHTPYGDEQPVDYQAVFVGDDKTTTFTYPAGTTAAGKPYAGGTLHPDDAIDNDVFEAAVHNDRQHYTRVDAGNNQNSAYVANQSFIYEGMPYGRGQVIESDVANDNTSLVDVVAVTPGTSNYYCFEDYTDVNGTLHTKGEWLQESVYKELVDDQKHFVIKGSQPNETTTLYVSRQSDIKDVTQTKVITALYQYTYYEDDTEGSIKLTNELHVVNIYLSMVTGMPSVGLLEAPATVLPGQSVELNSPKVTDGLVPSLTSGYELFNTIDDAEAHRNGVPFTPSETPVYWYQNQKNYVAFYSKSYLGKSYSNYVPLSVANYHDIADVMENHKDNHLYIDRSDVDRPSKIYLNDYTSLPDSDPRKGKNALDELKALYDLSLLNSPTLDDNGLIVSGDFQGHAPLSDHVEACQNLDIIFRTDVNHTGSWTSLGDNTHCFAGTVHGDGHTVSGLDRSLFGTLCGSVYNLGVTGSFTTAGIADTGSGYIENGWVKSSATTGFGSVRAVFGNPNRAAGDARGDVQLVNCYYADTNPYSTASTTHGLATQMPERSFYNGEVAYNLNGFYLGKRFYDHGSWSDAPMTYHYLTDTELQAAADATAADSPASNASADGRYPADGFHSYQPVGTPLKPDLGYVEQRFYDGDFRYAGGTIPTKDDVRLRTEEYTTGSGDDVVTHNADVFYPIWPDDYLYFGQRLNYGYDADHSHQDVPTAVVRSGDRLLTTVAGNRVMRAPAYFRSKQMSAAYYNPYAVFAAQQQKSEPTDPDVWAYPNMTAIDFTGSNGDLAGGYLEKWQSGKFYPPLLDNDGLTGFANEGLTRNLLVYTPVGTSTDDVVSNYLTDELYAETNPYYRTVDAWDSHLDNVRGHWVQQQSDGSFVALRDHLLVDREDFNAPLSYTFDGDHRMWYQRVPDRYVTLTQGWETVSLPFTAELVTTNTKGELTHFYSGSRSIEGSEAKIGHEYWLREYRGKKADNGDTFTAIFDYPQAAGATKTVRNTFLWDHYYSNSAQLDANNDSYQTYYRAERVFEQYPLLAAATPYVIGLPGPTYYEFDLSGEWTARNTATPAPTAVPRQTLTFASHTGITIGVSDDELVATPQDGYAFVPNYMGSEVAGSYHLDTDGDSFDQALAATATVPFRPYFVAGGGGSAPRRSAARSILLDSDDASFAINDADPSEGATGRLEVSARRHAIVVTSTLQADAVVQIRTLAGVLVTSYTIQPGQTVETPINIAGVYLVNRHKLAVQ